MWRVSEERICVRVGSLHCYALDSFDVSHVVYSTCVCLFQCVSFCASLSVSVSCVLCLVSPRRRCSHRRSLRDSSLLVVQSVVPRTAVVELYDSSRCLRRSACCFVLSLISLSVALDPAGGAARHSRFIGTAASIVVADLRAMRISQRF